MKGQVIIHKIYGKGRIINVSDKYITVKFASGTKKLLYSDVFPSVSDSKEKNVQPKVNNIGKRSEKKSIEPCETKIEAAQRRYRERIEAENAEKESYEAARQALKDQFRIREEKNRKANEQRIISKYGSNVSPAERRALEETKRLEKREREKTQSERKAKIEREAAENVKKRDAIARREMERINAETAHLEAKRYRDLLIGIRISRENEFKEVLEKRGIKYLMHFTRLDSLESILQNGFVPVNLQESFGIHSKHNDQNRYDSQLDCTSFSIGFPNYRLFYSFRNKYPDASWVILLIDSEIILSKEHVMYFCQTNAAREMKRIIRRADLCELSSFESMFCSIARTTDHRISSREDLRLEDTYTTDPQAEVLINDLIPPNYIRHICFPEYFERNDSFIAYKTTYLQGYSLKYSDKYFSYRHDYSFWKADQNHG